MTAPRKQPAPAPVLAPLAPLALDIATAAEIVSLHPHTLYGCVQAGEIPVVRVGTRLLIRPEALAAWLQAREGPYQPAPQVEPLSVVGMQQREARR